MDPTTASYYRAILFIDPTDTRPLPPSLMQLHGWAVKRSGALGLGGTISKATALTVAMAWMTGTKEGRKFSREETTLGDLFSEVDETEENEWVISAEEWDSLPAETDVIISKNRTTLPGKFLARRGSWVDVRVNGEVIRVRTNQVKIPAGV